MMNAMRRHCSVDVYLVTAGEGTLLAGIKLAERLREEVPELRVMNHFGGGNFKKQFKRADKVGAAVALVLGEDEVSEGTVVLKDLVGGTQDTYPQGQIVTKLAELV